MVLFLWFLFFILSLAYIGTSSWQPIRLSTLIGFESKSNSSVTSTNCVPHSVSVLRVWCWGERSSSRLSSLLLLSQLSIIAKLLLVLKIGVIYILIYIHPTKGLFFKKQKTAQHLNSNFYNSICRRKVFLF